GRGGRGGRGRHGVPGGDRGPPSQRGAAHRAPVRHRAGLPAVPRRLPGVDDRRGPLLRGRPRPVPRRHRDRQRGGRPDQRPRARAGRGRRLRRAPGTAPRGGRLHARPGAPVRSARAAPARAPRDRRGGVVSGPVGAVVDGVVRADVVGPATVSLVAAVSAAVLTLCARRTGPYARSWRLFAASLVAWSLGAALSSSAARGFHLQIPATDLAYAASTSLYLTAIVVHPALAPRVVRLRTVANGVIVAASFCTALWFVAGRHLHEANGDLLQTVVSLAYPASDVVLVHLGLTTVRRVRFTDPEHFTTARRTALLVTGAFAAFLLGDLRVLLERAHGFGEGLPLLTDLARVSGMGLAILGIRTAIRGGAERRDGSARTRGTDEGNRLGSVLGLVPVAAAVAAGVAFLTDWLARGVVDPPGMLMLSVVVSMVLARQSLTLNDNRQLSVSLQRAVGAL